MAVSKQSAGCTAGQYLTITTAAELESERARTIVGMPGVHANASRRAMEVLAAKERLSQRLDERLNKLYDTC